MIGHSANRREDQLTSLSVQQARVTPVNDVNRSYSVAYLPKVEGVHKVRQQTVLQAITGSAVPV